MEAHRTIDSITDSNELRYSLLHDQLHPPLWRDSNSLRASNFAWLPPTVHSNCSERLWLHARTFLVAMENRPGWPGESIEGVRFLFSPSTTPPLWPPKREYNAVSAERSMKFGSVVRVQCQDISFPTREFSPKSTQL
jgi:hypothetical protein